MTKKNLKTVEDLRALSEEADRLAITGRHKDCLDLLQKGLKAAHDISEAYVPFFESEITHFRDKDFTKQLSLVQKARDIAPDDWFLMQAHGVALSFLEQHAEALQLFEKVLKAAPKDYNALRSKGVSLSQLGREVEAIQLFDMALEIEPKDYNALRNKGVSLSKLGRQKEAIQLYDEALGINPDDPETHHAFAVALFKQDKTEEAFERIAIAREKAPNDKAISSTYAYLRSFLNKGDAEKTATQQSGEERSDQATASVGGLKGLVHKVRERFKNEIEGFKLDMEETKENINRYIREESPVKKQSLFFVLRKWNSYTPIVSGADGEDSVGGGYFLRHQDIGVVIDPGYNFIDNFHKAGHRIADISHIIITHAHNDHTIDFESLMTLFHTRKKETDKQKTVRIYMSPSALMKLRSIISANCDYAEVVPVSPGQTHTLDDTLGMRTLPAYHRDVIASDYAIGVRFDVKTAEGLRRIALTSDTSLFPTTPGKDCVNPDGPEIWSRYGLEGKELDLLIPHIG